MSSREPAVQSTSGVVCCCQGCTAACSVIAAAMHCSGCAVHEIGALHSCEHRLEHGGGSVEWCGI